MNLSKKQSSAKTVFVQGLFRGLGTALGATVLLPIVASIAIQLVDVLDWSMFTQVFLSNTEAISL